MTERRAGLPDWQSLGFNFRETDEFYRCVGDVSREPVWEAGEFLPFGPVSLSPAASFFSYGGGIFEGLKARRAPDGAADQRERAAPNEKPRAVARTARGSDRIRDRLCLRANGQRPRNRVATPRSETPATSIAHVCGSGMNLIRRTAMPPVS